MRGNEQRVEHTKDRDTACSDEIRGMLEASAENSRTLTARLEEVAALLQAIGLRRAKPPRAVEAEAMFQSLRGNGI